MAGVGQGDAADAAASFDPLRPKLMRVAYRMLGSVADAEDMVQEAFIRWMGADRSEVREPEAFLRRTVTRLCLDQLKSARRQRETYVGPWLPDPVARRGGRGGRHFAADAGARTAFPARAGGLPAARCVRARFRGSRHDDRPRCRRLPPARGRARTHVREARPRFEVDKQHGLELAEAFFTASRNGDMKALGAMLAADVSVHADGGGKRPATMRPVVGFDAVMKVHRALAAFSAKNASKLVRAGFVNGLPGFITLEADGEIQTTALDIEDGKIAAIYVVRNPDKLRHLH